MNPRSSGLRCAPPEDDDCRYGTISISGILGTSPAAKADRSISRSSVSKRTGTSNSNPAVTAAPVGGTLGAAKVTSPVAASQAKAVPAASSAPFTATRTVPATGLAIGRTYGACAVPYVLTS